MLNAQLKQHLNQITCTMQSKRAPSFILIFAMFCTHSLFSQSPDFEVTPLPFCSGINDEFAAVIYGDALVYCSNSLSNSNIKTDEGKLFNILTVSQRDSGSWKSPELFSKEITSLLNEGPVSFMPDGQVVFFSRNIQIEGNFKTINKPSNTLGIFSARLIDGVWTEITPFPFNSKEYSLGTPSLTPDGTRLYFASDKPGGLGGTDIYFSDLVNGQWQEPVHTGKQINTAGNESYPFVNKEGFLFFASDGIPGKGGKDIFYTKETDKGWLEPINLGAEINSAFDDYALVTDKNFKQGYFSSNRKRSADIYSFVSVVPQFGYCDTIKFVPQCFSFFDERFTDSLHLAYTWNFGKGIKKTGYRVSHCFDKPGNYSLMLTITHKLADSVYRTYTNYSFTVSDPYDLSITSPEHTLQNYPTEVKALVAGKSQDSLTTLYWNFGNGYLKGDTVFTGSFNSGGKKMLALGIEGQKDEWGRIPRRCVLKPMQVEPDFEHYAHTLSSQNYSKITIPQSETQQSIILNFKILTESIPLYETTLLEEKLEAYKFLELTQTTDSLSDSAKQIIEELASIFGVYSSDKLFVIVNVRSKTNTKQQQDILASMIKELSLALESNGFNSQRLEIIYSDQKRNKTNEKEGKQAVERADLEFFLLPEKIK